MGNYLNPGSDGFLKTINSEIYIVELNWDKSASGAISQIKEISYNK